MTVQRHFDPESYPEWIRRDVPRFEELQAAVIDAIPLEPETVLELGVGTGETTRRLVERYPNARITGLDSSPEMVFRARELPIETRLARMEDPLPDGPWDLVVSALTVHHLTSEQKRDLFRRVREQAKALVIGDVVEVDEPIAPLTEGIDFPDRAEDVAAWCDGKITWSADDLAVIRASY